MVTRMLPCAVATAVLTALAGTTAAGAAAGSVPVSARNSAQGAVPAAAPGRSGANYFELSTAARFSPPGAFVPSLALTYHMRLVPAAARIEVEQHSSRGRTTVELHVTGVRPGYAFGAHVHSKPCGADPAAAGGHYQHRVDPVQPPTDPEYVNPENEVWLDFTTDSRGAGSARATHSWGFRAGGARSVVIHDEPGTKGARVACFTVPFGAVSRG